MSRMTQVLLVLLFTFVMSTGCDDTTDGDGDDFCVLSSLTATRPTLSIAYSSCVFSILIRNPATQNLLPEKLPGAEREVQSRSRERVD